MDIVLIVLSIACAASTPLIYIKSFEAKDILFFMILILFFTVVVAYAVLSVPRFYMARIKFLVNTKIVSWDTGYNHTFKRPWLCYAVSAACAAIFFTVVFLQNAPLPACILLALAVGFALCGWWLMGRKRYEATLRTAEGFLLSHNGLISNGKAYVFNGYSNGITNTAFENGELVLTVLRTKQEEVLRFPVPQDKTEEVQSFIQDMKEYFEHGQG